MTNSIGGATITSRRAGVLQGVLLLAGSCMPVLGSTLITPILPRLSEYFGDVAGSEVLVPLIVSTPALLIAIFAPFAGQIVDRLGRKWLLVIAMLAYAAVGTAPVWLNGLTEILISRVLVGICEAAIMTVSTTLIVDYFHGARRTKYLGIQTVVTTLAATFFIILGGIVGAGGWHAPFWVYLLGLVIAIPMIFALWEPNPVDEADSRAAVKTKSRIPWRRISGPLLVTLFGGFSFYVLLVETSYLVVGTGVDATNTQIIGAVSAAASLATAIAGFVFSRLRHPNVRVLLTIAFGLQAVGMIVIWVFSSLPGVVLGAVIASAGAGLLLPALLIWAVSTTTFEERGRVTGLWTASFYLGQFLTPILMGVLSGITGALPVAVGIVGIAALIMMVVVVAFLRRAIVAAAPEVPMAPAEAQV